MVKISQKKSPRFARGSIFFKISQKGARGSIFFKFSFSKSESGVLFFSKYFPKRAGGVLKRGDSIHNRVVPPPLVPDLHITRGGLVAKMSHPKNFPPAAGFFNVSTSFLNVSAHFEIQFFSAFGRSQMTRNKGGDFC